MTHKPHLVSGVGGAWARSARRPGTGVGASPTCSAEIAVGWHKGGVLAVTPRPTLLLPCGPASEPIICIYGEFGVRLEDIVTVTEQGPRWFTQSCRSVHDRFGIGA